MLTLSNDRKATNVNVAKYKIIVPDICVYLSLRAFYLTVFFSMYASFYECVHICMKRHICECIHMCLKIYIFGYVHIGLERLICEWNRICLGTHICGCVHMCHMCLGTRALKVLQRFIIVNF